MKSNINPRLALRPQPLRRVRVSIQFLFSLYNQKVQVKLEPKKLRKTTWLTTFPHEECMEISSRSSTHKSTALASGRVEVKLD